MKNLTLRARLLMLVGGLLLLLVLSSVAAVLRLRASNAVLETVYNDRVVPMKQLKLVADGYSGAFIDTPHKVAAGALSPEEGLKALAQARQAIADNWKAYTATFLVPREQQLVAQAEPLMKRADDAGRQVEALLKAKDIDGLKAFNDKQLYPAIDPLAGVMDQLTQVQQDVAENEYTGSQATYRQVLWTNSIVSVVVIATAGLLAWLLVRAIVQGIARAVAVAETVAAGDLSARIDVTSQDEIGHLLAALKRMNDGLVRIVSSVRDGSDSIATGSSQIATGNADLSQRTEEQASNLQQTAASMEQLTATVKQNAETASEATRLAGDASAVAERGGAVVGEVVSTMQDITRSSQRIAEIIGTIDGIAFQTNILALNAAVEAARAGEQGRGFAVVAGEVRVLAQRSAGAAKEIKSLIGESVVKVEAGSRLVDDAGRTMTDVVTQVKRVSDLIREISAASHEQSVGIDQVGDAVSQLDQVTQQNAALVEESAAAAESLRLQAASLTETVAVFRLA